MITIGIFTLSVVALVLLIIGVLNAREQERINQAIERQQQREP